MANEVGVPYRCPQDSDALLVRVASPRHTTASSSTSRATLWGVLDNGLKTSTVPHLSLPMVDGNVRVSLEFLSQGTLGVADAMKILTQGVQVVKVSKEVFSCFESFVGCHQSGVLGKAEQKGHERIPLFAALTLLDVVNLTSLIFPQEHGRLAVERPHQRQKAPTTGETHQTTKHRIPGHEVKSADAIQQT